MDSDSLETIQQRVAAARAQNDTMRALLPQGAAPSLRANFARCAVDLACEHHSGLIRVTEAGEYGTAGALLRPVLEASTAAFWLMYVATCEQIKKLPTDLTENAGDDIPSLGSMATALIPTFPAIKLISDELKKGGRAKWLHKYTHGGTPQLMRRNTGWTEGEVMLTLVRADLFAILGACVETVIEPNEEIGNFGFARRDELAEEFRLLFNGPKIPEQPHYLPPAIADGCCEDH